MLKYVFPLLLHFLSMRRMNGVGRWGGAGRPCPSTESSVHVSSTVPHTESKPYEPYAVTYCSPSINCSINLIVYAFSQTFVPSSDRLREISRRSPAQRLPQTVSTSPAHPLDLQKVFQELNRAKLGPAQLPSMICLFSLARNMTQASLGPVQWQTRGQTEAGN